MLVCIGGLLDGDLIVNLQMWASGKSVYSGSGSIADVAPEHRLGTGNPTFRANLAVAEGTQSSTAILSKPNGVVLQDLPFAIELKKFVVEHYSTGMPKLFASDIVIHDLQTGEKTPARVEVNHPVNYKGVEIYQSSFDDGGSSVTLKALPLRSSGKSFELQGVIGGSSALTSGNEKLTLEYTALRVLNVENFSAAGTSGPNAVDVRKVDLREAITARLGAANKVGGEKALRNVGPSITYKLRDPAGQAREFHNYMLPVDMGDGAPVFLLGVRDTPAEPFRYLRIPADESSAVNGFLSLFDTLSDPAARALAVRRYVAQVVDPARPELATQLGDSAGRALALFSGAETKAGSKAVGGLQAIADFLETNVPEAERAKAGDILVRILNGTLFELAQISRERQKLAPLIPNDKTQAFMTQAVVAMSDAFVYPAPLLFQLSDFKQVQASVFQVARAPGKRIVYLGCALLILGVFAMLYVRERRIWIWVTAPADPGESTAAGNRAHAVMAMSVNRKTMDSDRDFVQLRDQLFGVKE